MSIPSNIEQAIRGALGVPLAPIAGHAGGRAWEGFEADAASVLPSVLPGLRAAGVQVYATRGGSKRTRDHRDRAGGNSQPVARGMARRARPRGRPARRALFRRALRRRGRTRAAVHSYGPRCARPRHRSGFARSGGNRWPLARLVKLHGRPRRSRPAAPDRLADPRGGGLVAATLVAGTFRLWWD